MRGSARMSVGKMSTVTYKNQPAIDRTRGKVPLAGTSHLYRVKRILWPQAVESVLQGLLIPTSLHVCSGHSQLGDMRVDSDRAVSPDVVGDAARLPFADQSFNSVLCDPPYNGCFQWNHDMLFELSRVARRRIIFQHWFMPAVVTSYSYSFGAGSATVAATRGSQTHTTVVDALGRTIQVSTPEGGTVHYFWDAAPPTCWNNQGWPTPGDLGATLDNAGNYVCYGYDGLHRVVGILTKPSAPCPNFVYDTATPPSGSGITLQNTVGRMVNAYTSSACNGRGSVLTDEWFSYDADGRMTDVWELTPHSGGVYYHTTVSYYPNGTPKTLSGLPGYSTLNYGVDGEGRWNTATLGTVAVVSGVTYDAAGKPLVVNIGSGTDKDQYSYDALERMSQYQFFVGSQSNKGIPSWNPNGSLGSLAIADGFNSADTQTCTFGYDDVARLTSDDCGSVWSQTYAYDQYDNLTKSGSLSWIPGYNPANNHYQNGATYDAAGNLTADGAGNSYTWNQYGKMATVNGTTVTYDALGRAVTNGSVDILYTPLGKIGVLQSPTQFYNSYVPLPGGGAMSLGCCQGTNIWYLHRDWLGSSHVVSSVTTGGSGQVLNDRSFSPYGDSYQNSGCCNDPLLFAGLNSDLFATSGKNSILYDTPNRELANNASRWLSPDPSGGSWNAYAYPTDPNTTVDVSGLFPEIVSDCGGDEMPCTAEDNDLPSLPDAPSTLQFCPGAPGCVVQLKVMYFSLPALQAFGDSAFNQSEWDSAVNSAEPHFAGGFCGPQGISGSDAAFGLVMGTFNAPQAALAHSTCGDGITCTLAVSFVTGAAIGGVQGIVSAGGSLPSILQAAESGIPAALRAGQLAEGPALEAIGSGGKVVFKPTTEQIESAAFRIIVGDAKYTASGRPVSTIFDGSVAGGLAEVKSGSSVLNSSYQLRLQTYGALVNNQPYAILTSRPINPTFYDWLVRWGVSIMPMP